MAQQPEQDVVEALREAMSDLEASWAIGGMLTNIDAAQTRVLNLVMRNRQDILAALSASNGGWMPIESAPKDGGPLILCWPDGHVGVGWWEDEPFHKKPRPHFKGHYLGKVWGRKKQPLAWQPLPNPPARGEGEWWRNLRGLAKSG